VLFVKGRVEGWRGNEPQPGLVEVSLTDARGKQWRFIDKAPIFSCDVFSAETAYPIDILIGCEELLRHVSPDGHDIVTVSTARPWGLETDDGVSEFEVSRDQLVAR
jgi:hypothetical protein